MRDAHVTRYNRNFIETSDTFSHAVVNSKLRKHGLGIEGAENWLDYCAERVEINSLTSWQTVRSGIPQGLILILMLFSSSVIWKTESNRMHPQQICE